VIGELARALASFVPRARPAPLIESARAAAAARPPQRRALLVNDTSRWYHWGCSCTSLALRAGLRERGYDVRALPIEAIGALAPLPTGSAALDDAAMLAEFERANPSIAGALAGADEVVINGEGSLHGATPASLGLLYLAWIARTRFGRPVRIVNHSCYPEDPARPSGGALETFYRRVYERVDTVVVREPVSAALLGAMGIEAMQGFDCLPLFAAAHAETISRTGTDHVLIAGSVAAGPAAVAACARIALDAKARGLRPLFLFGANANLAADDREFARLLHRATDGAVGLFHATSEAEFLSAIASAQLLVSGRFHYSIAAAWLGTPFVALDSNTPKMEGLMDFLRLDRRVDAAGLLRDPSPARIDDGVRAAILAAATRNLDW
jgi:hypothetical protein